MAKLYDLARMTTATTGTGTLTLGSAVTGWLSFAGAGISDGDVIDYAINDPGTNPTATEIGTGTYTASGTTLSRTVLKSTNSNSAINLSGNAHVLITPSAESLGYTGQRPGTVTNDSANAGNVGEFVTSYIGTGSQISLVTATAKTLTSISLTAGDWDVRGAGIFNPAGTTTISRCTLGINTTTNTLPATADEGYLDIAAAFTTGVNTSLNTGLARISLASTTTYYLIAYSVFAVSTMAVYGRFSARRVR